MNEDMNNTIERERFIAEDPDNSRIDEYVLGKSAVFSTMKSIRKAIKRGDILLDNKKVDPFVRVKTGSEITVYSHHEKKKIFELEIRVVYEDSHLAVVEKPPGYPVNGNRFKTIENALPYNLSESYEKDTLDYPLPVHRLDSSTGGLLLIAKTRSALASLSEQFHSRVVGKRYRAVLMGKLTGDGRVDEKLDGRASLTYYCTLKTVPSLRNEYLTLVDLWPVSGRMHQLRRHMSSIGHPVLGDSIYGEEGEILKGKGLFLWAVEKSFIHPAYEWLMNIRINEAPRFGTILAREERRWLKYNKADPGVIYEK